MKKMTSLLFVVALFAMIGCVKENSGGTAEEDGATFAVVNGQEIKGKEVLDKIRTELEDVKRSEYEMKRRATEEVVEEKILEGEAKKQGTSTEKLLAQFDSLKEKDVSKDEINSFLQARHIDPSKLSAQEKSSIPQIIKSQRMYEARQQFIKDLRDKANVQFKLARPPEKLVDVAVGAGVPNGPASAKVKIIEFSDFQCPFCARGRQRIEEIKDKYKDKVAIYFRNFPLEQIHPYAFHAAEAAACVLEMKPDKWWDYHNTLFDHQEQGLGEKDLIKYAKDMGLDDKAFTDCLKSGKKQAEIRKDIAEGTAAGVNSTPTFFVNGRPIRGAQPIETFAEIIDDQLSR